MSNTKRNIKQLCQELASRGIETVELRYDEGGIEVEDPPNLTDDEKAFLEAWGAEAVERANCKLPKHGADMGEDREFTEARLSLDCGALKLSVDGTYYFGGHTGGEVSLNLDEV